MSETVRGHASPLPLYRFAVSALRMLASVIALVILLYIALVGLLFFFQANLVYFPTRVWAATPAERGLPYEEIWLETTDQVKLSGWFIPAESPKGVILFFHGNGGNISHRLWSLQLFHRLDLSTLIIDYRGYGQSEGRPSEQGTYLDAEAAWRYLVEERQTPPDQIVIFGESLGGAVATWVAQTYQPGALILVSTFTSIPDMGAQSYPFIPVRLLARINYDTLARLPQLDCPILIIHSPDDEIIPYSHGQRLYEAAREPKEFLEIRGSHNEGIFISAEQYETGLTAFMTKYVGSSD